MITTGILSCQTFDNNKAGNICLGQFLLNSFSPRNCQDVIHDIRRWSNRHKLCFCVAHCRADWQSTVGQAWRSNFEDVNVVERHIERVRKELSSRAVVVLADECFSRFAALFF